MQHTQIKNQAIEAGMWFECTQHTCNQLYPGNQQQTGSEKKITKIATMSVAASVQPATGSTWAEEVKVLLTLWGKGNI